MNFKKTPTIIYLCVLPLLISLGIWQLNRATEKSLILEQRQEGMASSGVVHLSNSTDDNIELLKYKNVKLQGHYDVDHQFLIDNQISAGKVGYLVLTPFILSDGSRSVLVNRGWVPLNGNRANLPELTLHTNSVEVTGRVNSFPSVGIKLAGAEAPSSGWPSVVQVVDSHILADKLGYALFTFQVELDKELPDGFKREWQVNTIMLPEQHIAYAVQWFALAVTLTGLFFWYSKNNKDE